MSLSPDPTMEMYEPGANVPGTRLAPSTMLEMIGWGRAIPVNVWLIPPGPPAVTLYEYAPGFGPRMGTAVATPNASVAEDAFLSDAPALGVQATGTPDTGKP